MMLLRNTAKSLQILNNLMAEGTQPTIILWAISRQIRQLYELAGSPEKISALRLPTAALESLRFYLQKLHKKDLDEQLSLALSVEKSVKGATKALPSETLAKLVISFCQPNLIQF
jgi:DNA polymerase-3 subunit delta